MDHTAEDKEHRSVWHVAFCGIWCICFRGKDRHRARAGVTVRTVFVGSWRARRSRPKSVRFWVRGIGTASGFFCSNSCANTSQKICQTCQTLCQSWCWNIFRIHVRIFLPNQVSEFMLGYAHKERKNRHMCYHLLPFVAQCCQICLPPRRKTWEKSLQKSGNVWPLAAHIKAMSILRISMRLARAIWFITIIL